MCFVCVCVFCVCDMCAISVYVCMCVCVRMCVCYVCALKSSAVILDWRPWRCGNVEIQNNLWFLSPETTLQPCNGALQFSIVQRATFRVISSDDNGDCGVEPQGVAKLKFKSSMMR